MGSVCASTSEPKYLLRTSGLVLKVLALANLET